MARLAGGRRELRVGQRNLAVVAIGIITLMTASTCFMLDSFMEPFLIITVPINVSLTPRRCRPRQVGTVSPISQMRSLEAQRG